MDVAAAASSSSIGAYREAGLTEAEFFGPRYMRLQHLKNLMAAGRVDASLRYRREAA